MTLKVSDGKRMGNFAEVAISVDSVSKCYHIYQRPNDRLKQYIYPRLRNAVGLQNREYFRQFWALKDVSFEIKKGEALGIIGRNGSGKSTLLQIICGTLNQTAGTIQKSGRVAALLELGSGFNPEFTGRENVYLNAILLGLTREEVDSRLDLILAFADIGEFIDQPVKTYSSGMYVRLAFAVIAHVDADILVVDEALAVGDAVFTQKCMRFIRSFLERGALLFVSHDIASVQNLCRSAIWLGAGEVKMAGSAKDVAEAYHQFTLQEIYGASAQLTPVVSKQMTNDADDVDKAEPAPVIDYGAVATVSDNFESANGWKSGQAEITSVVFGRLSSGAEGVYKGGELVRLVIKARTFVALEDPILGFLVRDKLGQDLFGENTLQVTDISHRRIEAGASFQAIFEFRLPMLPNGQYAVMASVADGDAYQNLQHHWIHNSLIINVSSSSIRYGLVGIQFQRVEIGLIDE